jgi:hypothetical protein
MDKSPHFPNGHFALLPLPSRAAMVYQLQHRSARQGCVAVFHGLSAKGYRVLAVAYAEVGQKAVYGK